MLEPRSKGAKPAGENKIGTGRGTLRLRSKGPATVEDEVRFSRGNKCLFLINVQICMKQRHCCQVSLYKGWVE